MDAQDPRCVLLQLTALPYPASLLAQGGCGRFWSLLRGVSLVYLEPSSTDHSS